MVKVVLNGERVQGRFVLFQTRGKNWMIHRMDAPARPDWEPLPDHLLPMLATPGTLPPDDGWAFEMKWDGVRGLVRVDGGRIRITSRDGDDITVKYPELRPLGEHLGTTQVLLDGELVSFDEHGRLSASGPAVFLIFDLLHLDGRSLLGLPYEQRRELLLALEFAGDTWQTPPAFAGSGRAAIRASREQGLGGVIAKRIDSAYTPGRRSPNWVQASKIRTVNRN